MLRPSTPTLPICPWCGEPGIHGTPDECLRALHRAVQQERDKVSAERRWDRPRPGVGRD